MLCSNILGWYQYCTILWLTRLDLSLINTTVNGCESTKIILDSEVLSARYPTPTIYYPQAICMSCYCVRSDCIDYNM